MRSAVLATLLSGLVPAAGFAQPGLPLAMPAPASAVPAEEANAIPFDTGGVPGGAPREEWLSFKGDTIIRNVTRATLTPILPPRGKATGTAAIVAPGGGFSMLSMQEGYVVARRLAERGIAAFVLKYRINPTPPGADAFNRTVAEAMRAPAANWSKRPALVAPSYAIADGAAALALVRARAAEWGAIGRGSGWSASRPARSPCCKPPCAPRLMPRRHSWRRSTDR